MAISTDSRSVVTVLAPTPEAPPAASDARHRRLPWRPSRRWLRLLRRPGIGLAMAAATTALIAWHLGRPALWLDETASVVATQRTWPDLWKLLQGTDAPLVPYYAVLKLLTETATTLVPSLAAHPEVLFRAPSLVAVALAGWALGGWLARFSPAPVAVGSGAVFLLASGVSRYGQEARPYGILLLAAVLCTVAWTWAISHRRRTWVLLYALAVAGLVACNPLAGSLVAAHLAAALALERGDRLKPVLRTLTGAVIGALLVSPLAVSMISNGGGASHTQEITWDRMLRVFVSLFTLDRTPLFGIGYLLILALLGATRVVDRRYRFIARLALAWAAVPPALLLPAVFLRPNLLIGRYLLFTVPGWAILAGLGIATITDVIRRLVPAMLERGEPWWPGWTLRREPAGKVSDGERWRRARAKQRLATAVAAVVAGALVIGLGLVQQPSLRQIRTANGHGGDPRPALAEATSPEYEHLPIIPGSRPLAMQVGAYDPSVEHRLSGFFLQRDRTDIWPLFMPGGVRRELARRYPRAVVLLGVEPGSPDCNLPNSVVTNYFVEHCMPLYLQGLGYRVVTAHPHGRGIVFAVVERPSPLRLRRPPHRLTAAGEVPRRS